MTQDNTSRKVSRNKILYPARVAKHVVKGPRNIASLEANTDRLQAELDSTREELNAQKQHIANLLSEIEKIANRQENTNDRLSNINHKLNVAGAPTNSSSDSEPGYRADTIADDHNLDNFYIAFEDKFRGTEEMIKERLKEHLVHFSKNETGNKKLPIVDLGCGRGELLGVLKDNKIPAIGVDMNVSMVERATSNGYKAVENDAVSYLLEQKNNSVAAVVGFHIVEHLPFGSLIKMFEECYRVVAKNGYVFFETPNPENVMVGACNFYMDPSHINPIPPPLLAFALETVGFETEIIRLHPVKEQIEHSDPVIQDIAVHLYGARDYAVKAYKR